MNVVIETLLNEIIEILKRIDQRMDQACARDLDGSPRERYHSWPARKTDPCKCGADYTGLPHAMECAKRRP